jgi:hypothetical protein
MYLMSVEKLARDVATAGIGKSINKVNKPLAFMAKLNLDHSVSTQI